MSAVPHDAELHLALVGRADQRPLVPVICVHDTDGDGPEQLAAVRASARQGLDFDALLVCPSFQTPYQLLVGGIDRWLMDHLVESAAELRFRITAKACIYGLGGGGGFAHRFAMRHPDCTLACAAFAADCWTLANGTPFGPMIDKDWFRRPEWSDRAIFQSANTRANRNWRQVRYLVGCGREDTPGRVAAAERFHAELEFAGAKADFVAWAGHRGEDPHSAPPKVMEEMWGLFNQAVADHPDIYD